MEKENQRVMLTKSLLKNGLLRLLENKNIDKINVTELCRESGINRATFYKHYETPHDVLLEIEDELVLHLIEELHKKTKHIQQVDLLIIAETMCQYIYEHTKQVRLLLKNATDQALRKALNNSYKRLLKQYTPSDMDEEDIKLAIAYLAGGCFFSVKTWLEEDINKTPQEVAQLIAGLFSSKIVS